MNTYVEIIDAHGEDYYYAGVEMKDDVLQISRHQGIFKCEEKKLKISNIHRIKISVEKDHKQMSFYHGKNKYTFFDLGNGIAAYLSTVLNTQLYGKAV